MMVMVMVAMVMVMALAMATMFVFKEAQLYFESQQCVRELGLPAFSASEPFHLFVLPGFGR